ncbi:DUF4268 domain-containing protein [Candidatus Zixiibacteriota bacterium]
MKDIRTQDRSTLQNLFWDDIDGRMKNIGVVKRSRRRTRAQKENTPHVYIVPLGSSHGFISNTIDTEEGVLRARLYMYSELTEKIYSAFIKERNSIEEELVVDNVLWNPPPKNRMAWDTRTIGFIRSFDLFNESNWDATLDWTASRIVILHHVFRRRLHKYAVE